MGQFKSFVWWVSDYWDIIRGSEWLRRIGVAALWMVIFVLALITVAIVIAIALSWMSWDELKRLWDAFRGQDSHSTTTRNIGLLVAGIVALLIAVWRSKVAERSLLNERYQRGAEMLGSEVLSVRLGGILALQRLSADDPKRYHLQVAGLFGAFVRFPMQDPRLDDDLNEQLRPDIQATMEVICSRSKSELKVARNNGYVTNLHGAQISRASLPYKNLSGISLWNADLSYAFLQSSDLSGTRLREANLSGAHLIAANLSGTDLMEVDLSAAHLIRAKMSGANLMEANLSGTELIEANLSGAYLIAANLSGAYLIAANLSGADMTRVNLSGANLRGVNLSRTSLMGADLSDADLIRSDLSGAKLSSHAGKVQGLTQTQLDLAWAHPDNPPTLDGISDAETGEQLTWRN